jgi:lysophospholipase L1-like esterase
MNRLVVLVGVAALSGCSQSAGPKSGQADAGLSPDARVSTADASVDAPLDAPPKLTMVDCYEQMFPNYTTAELDYDQFSPTINTACAGTNHQQITGVERVVFLGDSVTTGTPPAAAHESYRARLAGMLAQKFGLQAPDGFWQAVNPLSGEGLIMESGDFASCAKWGARADDLMQDNDQVVRCIPPNQRGKRTLVIMTVGGNDIAAIAKAGGEGASLATTTAMAVDEVRLVRETIEWLKTPGRFPNGVFVVFNTIHEYTDATGDTASCAIGAAAYQPWPDPQDLRDLVIWINEQHVSIAVDTQTDIVFMLENFCGHGFHNTDPAAPCYRGPNTARWLDDTCIHPNAVGHGELANLMKKVIDE